MTAFEHPRFTRRTALQAGAIGLLGLGTNHLAPLRAAAARPLPTDVSASPTPTSVIYVFLSGGLAQHESFDPKPDAPEEFRGEFAPIATRSSGLQISEHLPRLAACSERWSVIRSLTHPSNDHSQGHMIMLSGRREIPVGFDPNAPKPSDWPSIAAVAASQVRPRNNLPPAAVLPEKLIHRTGRVIPGQFAGQMGDSRDPWFIGASPYNSQTYGAFPTHGFHHERGLENPAELVFQAPQLALPEGLSRARVLDRLSLLSLIDGQRATLERLASTVTFDRHREQAISLLASPAVRAALDVTRADDALQERYGRNSFGWSLLMARRLVEAGVPLVQVNLGNNETWDTHQAAFPNLKNFLLPPLDQGLTALFDDLQSAGLFDSTLIVVAGEFGRTPRISKIAGAKLAGRDHWGAVQSVLVAGGGTRGGAVIGSSDRIGAFPAADPQSPENLAATIYDHLGIPATAAWHDALDRPHHVYYGDPIRALWA
ncbi:MAG: DUF1501 domain-containing protein [Pirellulales bacterium]|nr:DUF1501 domain-containing protein [Pirellulales bacterium]